MRHPNHIPIHPIKWKRAATAFFLIATTLALCAVLGACSFMNKPKSITIASKTFTENMLLGEMYAQLIERHTDIKVERNFGFGNTQVCYTALANGEVDLYVEYTGTLYSEILKLEYSSNSTPDWIYNTVKKELQDRDGITVLPPIGLNNSFALAMPKVKSDAMNVKTMSDLATVSPNLIFAANDIYYARFNDGYENLVAKYDLQFKANAKMDTPKLYEAVKDGRVDVIVVYATDSRLKENDMTVLEDDRRFFPSYNGVPVVRKHALEQRPELNDVLALLSDRIRTNQMQELNYLVDVEHLRTEDVARSFLTEEGLLD